MTYSLGRLRPPLFYWQKAGNNASVPAHHPESFMRRFALVASLLIPLTAHAYTNDALFADFTGLSKLLRANGVEPSRVDWNPIEAMCLGLKEPTSQLTYNQCRYAKALDQTVFASDRSGCQEEAAAYVPPQQNTTITAATSSKTDEKSSTTINTGNPYPVDLRSARRAAYTRCMLDLGWVNPRNWQLGRNTGK